MGKDILQRYALFWRLSLVLVIAIFLTTFLGGWLTSLLRDQAQDLGQEAKQVLLGYASEAEQAWRTKGEAGVADWLSSMAQREQGDIMVVDARDQSLSGSPLSPRQRAGLRFQRHLDGKMSFRYGKRMPYIGIPFPNAPAAGRLILQLPPRYRPGTYWPMLHRVLLVAIPASSALIIGLLLFWRARVPLLTLQRQVLAFKDDASARVSGSLSQRSDEFGELARSVNRMADQVSGLLDTQRQLLNDLSHELRTPLSRLGVALESHMDEAGLRERVASELACMQQLVSETLALGWQDPAVSEITHEPVSVPALWDVVTENAGFESGWSAQRFPMQLPETASVQGNLNLLVRVLENLVRNAIRYSPQAGVIRLAGHRDGGCWHLTVTDMGPGVPPEYLNTIFDPFVRLDRARGEGGFGLGLSIAMRSVHAMGGDIWAENARPGLKVHLRLPAA